MPNSSHSEAVHDLAQHQAAIMACAELVLRWAMPRSRIEEKTRAIYRSAAALSGPIKILLGENIRFVPKVEPISLNLILDGEIGSLRAELGDEVTIDLVMVPDLPLIDGDQAMLEDLFRQLALNARIAMRDNVGKRLIRIATATKNRTVIAKVSDNGIGIDPEAIRKILRGEVFTTRETGTGHGFENIRRTLAALNARMDVETAGGTTTFIFYFNALAKAA